MSVAFEPRVEPDFVEVLGSHATAGLDEAPGAAYGLWADGRLAYVNRGWFSFAHQNDSSQVPQRWGLGANIWEAIPSPLREFYEEGFGRALSGDEPWSHHYECSSPELLRKFHMLVYPLSAQSCGYGRGLLIVNSLEVEIPHPDGDGGLFTIDDYLDEHRILHQCMHCRRVRRADQSAWDWIPELVRNPRNNMSGSLCTPCFAHHYPGAPPP